MNSVLPGLEFRSPRTAIVETDRALAPRVQAICLEGEMWAHDREGQPLMYGTRGEPFTDEPVRLNSTWTQTAHAPIER